MLEYKITNAVNDALIDTHQESIKAIVRIMCATVDDPAIDAEAKIDIVLKLHSLRQAVNRKVNSMMRDLW